MVYKTKLSTFEKNMILNKSCTLKIFKLCFVPVSSSWPYFLAGGRNGFEIGDSGSHVIREAGRGFSESGRGYLDVGRGYNEAGRGYSDRRGAPRNHYGNGSRERGKFGWCHEKLFLFYADAFLIIFFHRLIRYPLFLFSTDIIGRRKLGEPEQSWRLLNSWKHVRYAWKAMLWIRIRICFGRLDPDPGRQTFWGLQASPVLGRTLWRPRIRCFFVPGDPGKKKSRPGSRCPGSRINIRDQISGILVLKF